MTTNSAVVNASFLIQNKLPSLALDLLAFVSQLEVLKKQSKRLRAVFIPSRPTAPALNARRARTAASRELCMAALHTAHSRARAGQ